ncbi:unnamed protein product [Prunus armeniaca]|uniref:Uncharacterized protein n=1 Tax=Prunus armeniaca TaxID=36596 RepID=A0A6J5U8J2_PRUAR|nr:unnamed protein product [Prunus armeniaca]
MSKNPEENYARDIVGAEIQENPGAISEQMSGYQSRNESHSVSMFANSQCIAIQMNISKLGMDGMDQIEIFRKPR